MTGSLVKKNNYGDASGIFFAQLCVYFFAPSAVKNKPQKSAEVRREIFQ